MWLFLPPYITWIPEVQSGLLPLPACLCHGRRYLEVSGSVSFLTLMFESDFPCSWVPCGSEDPGLLFISG